MKDLIALCKPGIVVMVLFSMTVGFYLASSSPFHWVLFIWALAGTGMEAAGSLALNQYMERDVDAKMPRTQNRPLPAGRMRPAVALIFGSSLCILGCLILLIKVNPLSCILAAATCISYLGLYTPLKRISSLCTVVGAIPGALPPLIGWAAVQNSLSIEAWILFSILFLWQFPHSLAIARLYQNDYALAGIQVLPVVDGKGMSTERQIILHSTALVVVGMMPSLMNMAGMVYFFIALALGVSMLWASIKLVLKHDAQTARSLMMASHIYLPGAFLLLCLDKL